MNKPNPDDPLEVKLAFEVKSCRKCTFFWPRKGAPTYGPYPTYDFKQNYPAEVKPPKLSVYSYPWVKGTTNKPGFPEPEIVDGCRKAPIMTIGINPNLTAALPETTGAAWAYPYFSDTRKSDGVTKYAWYYRYRTVDQEHLDPDFVRKFFLRPGQVKAKADGEVVSATATTEASKIQLEVKYGNGQPQKRTLRWKAGTPRYVLLRDASGAASTFQKGELLAAKLQVPAGKPATIYHEQQSYYERIVPVLNEFSAFLHGEGHKSAALRVGEDVCQLDMVACASPHWGPQWLGTPPKSETTIIDNCVTQNAWAVKQLIQTRPALLILVGEPSFAMFNQAFGKWIRSKKALPRHPVDGAFTLLRQTTDPEAPVYLEFSYSAGAQDYKLKTRLVVSPHFSYKTNFYPQFRLSPSQWHGFQRTFPSCTRFLLRHPGVTVLKPAQQADYIAFELVDDAKATFAALKAQFADALKVLMPTYVSANASLTDVMEDLYKSKELSWTRTASGGYLSRTQGGCRFCVNQHWTFPQGCPYGKVTEPSPPPGFLEAAAAAFVKGGK